MINYRQSAGKIKPLAYILGVYLGDGNIQKCYKQKYFRLNTIDQDFAEATDKTLRMITGYRAKIRRHPVKKSKNDNYALIHHHCTDLCEYLEKATNNKEIIPSFVYDQDQKWRIEFIAGLMDSEGYASVANKGRVENSNAMELGIKTTSMWMYDLQRILESVGCITQGVKICKPNKEGHKQSYRIRIWPITFLQSGCYFRIKRKQQRFEILRDYTPKSHKLQFLRDMI